MKGLLIKDFKLLKNQRMFMVIAVAVSIWMLVRGNDRIYIFSYLAAMFSVIVTGTIGYDEENNGMGFIFTFPVSRSQYVLEKYVFGMLILAAAVAGVFAASVVISAAKTPDYGPDEWAAAIATALLVSVLIQSITIPVQLKFGSAKSRAAFLIIMLCILAAVYAAEQIAKAAHMDLSAIEGKIVNASTLTVIAGICLILAALTGISYAVSVTVMKRKQF